jgi:hypothetical protein
MNADWDANWKENFQLETGLIAVCVPHIHAPPSWNVLHGDYIQSYVQLSSSWHGMIVIIVRRPGRKEGNDDYTSRPFECIQ